MRQYRWVGLVTLVGLGLVGMASVTSDAVAAGGKEAAAAKPKAAKPLPPSPAVKEPIKLTPDGFRLGVSPNELADFYDKVLDDDYRPLFRKVSVGPELKALEAALAEQKSAFRRSKVEFGTLPTGVDNTPLKGEYSYRNNEMMMSLTRGGYTRYFFFLSGRLYKSYDAVPLKEGAELGATFQDAATALSKRFGVGGRVVPADPQQGRFATTVDWVDNTMRVRAIDRSDESLVGLVFEDKGTADRLLAQRAAQKNDEGALDPAVQAITRPGQILDPNTQAADSYTGKSHATPGAPAPGAAPGAKGAAPKHK